MSLANAGDKPPGANGIPEPARVLALPVGFIALVRRRCGLRFPSALAYEIHDLVPRKAEVQTLHVGREICQRFLWTPRLKPPGMLEGP